MMMDVVSETDAENRSTPWQATILTLFPAMFPGPLGHSLAGKALAAGIWQLRMLDIRGGAQDKYRAVDDASFGGGPGLVLRPDIVDAALSMAYDSMGARMGARPVPLVYLTPHGRALDQERVRSLAAGPGVMLLCGRYEGIDARLSLVWNFEEISLGDFVLSGGESAALALLDACVRLLPGVIGTETAIEEESFTNGLLEYPHFTRPRLWSGQAVPDVLVSGDHARVALWRQAAAEQITARRRPDLWQCWLQAGNQPTRLAASEQKTLAIWIAAQERQK